MLHDAARLKRKASSRELEPQWAKYDIHEDELWEGDFEEISKESKQKGREQKQGR